MNAKYHILVTGAAGFIGAKVCEFLVTKPELGGDEPHKMNEVTKIIHTKLKRPDRLKRLNRPKILYKPFHPADILATWVDITKAKKLLGWKPKVKIDQVIQNSVDWYLENRNWTAKIKL